jgi:sarcosine oxidase subunit beta
MKLPGADVAVIGGGVIGTSIAYQLARRGVSVALIERSDIAAGTSSACDMALHLQTKTPGAKLSFAIESFAIYRTLEEELGCDLEYANIGGMIVAQTPDEADYVKDKVATLKSHGVEAYFLDRKDVLEREPALIDNIFGASFCPEDSVVSSMLLALAWAEAAARLGACIYTYTEATGIEVHSGRIARVLTSAGEIEVGVVVNACGVWAPSIAQMTGLDLPIIPRRGQLLVTEPAPPLLGTRILAARYLMSKAMPSGGGAQSGKLSTGVTLHQTRRGNFLIGSTREFVGFDRRVTYEGLSLNLHDSVQLVPDLGHLHIIRSFAGWRPTSPDGLPILERSSEISNFYTAAGHEGDGVALSPITGLRMAQLITDEIEPDALASFSLSRFAEQGSAVH